MVIEDPAQRASAAQMLVKLNAGKGLSTPRDQVPALTSGAPPESAAARALAQAPPPSTTRTAQTNPTGLQRNGNIPAAPQDRVANACDPPQAQPSRQLRERHPKPYPKS
jgi:hypothetical protein